MPFRQRRERIGAFISPQILSGWRDDVTMAIAGGG
jgi:hypothetical protein